MKHFIGWPLEQKLLDSDYLLGNSSAIIVEIYSKTEELFETLDRRLSKYGELERRMNIDLDNL